MCCTCRIVVFLIIVFLFDVLVFVVVVWELNRSRFWVCLTFINWLHEILTCSFFSYRTFPPEWKKQVGACLCPVRWVLRPLQTDASLLANNSQHCWMLRTCCVRLHTLLPPSYPASSFPLTSGHETACAVRDEDSRYEIDPVACCCVMLGVVAQSLKPVKRLSRQLPTSPKHSATMLD